MQVALRSAALGLCLLVAALPVRGDGRAGTWLSVYSDDDALTVISPQLSAAVELEDRVELLAAYEADIITAASVDVVTAASPRGYEEVRHGGSLGVAWSPEPGSVYTAKYIPSREPDYESHGFLLRVAHELYQRRLDLRVDARANLDRVGRVGEPRESFRRLELAAVGVATGVVIDRSTVASAGYELQALEGFMQSPYRFATVVWSDSAGTRILVPERVPSQRVRHALAVGLKRALTPRWFASAGYRFYVDDWGIHSHTGSATLEHSTSREEVIVGIEARAYWQSAARFYRAEYAAPPGVIPGVRTADKMLTESWSLLVGGRCEVAFGPVSFFDRTRAFFRLDLYDQHFVEFPRLERRTAVIAAAGLAGEY